MTFKKTILFASMALLVLTTQAQQVTNQNLRKLATEKLTAYYKANYQKALQKAKQLNWPLQYKVGALSTATLVGIDAMGKPKYYTTYDNIIAAATIKTNQLWQGGTTGFNLSGSLPALKDKLGIWDGGSVFANHTELRNRIEQIDNPSSVSDHATHVSGTMIASGINPIAKGMSYGANNLKAWDFNDDVTEIATASQDLLLSNHSYGILSGWVYNSSQSRWEFRGEPGAKEDFKFGYYSEDAQALDSIAYTAPYYLIVKAAGNNRNQNGPAVGSSYFRYDSTGKMISAGNRPAGISSNDGYDIIPWDGNAKNILTVGAVNGLKTGYTRPSDVSISNFSSWGPTDDGRIKPDLVADGVNVTSCVSGNQYATYSGTSMATPSVTGSLFLLQELHKQLNPQAAFLKSASIKGLAIHTADEAGSSNGPDYVYGWGLLNMEKAATIIKEQNQGNHLLAEKTLINSESFSIDVVASGKGNLKATICWTDPQGVAEMENVLNNRTPKIINDLDLRITRKGNTTFPWKLNPASPSAAAQRADNTVDNVEQVTIDNTIPGETYTITVTHKNSLKFDKQDYTLLLSGIGGTTPCIATSSSSNIGLDSISFSTLRQKNNQACSAYNNYKNVRTNIEIRQSLPLYVRLASCNNYTGTKAVKAYIDYNANGLFEPTELVAASGLLSNSTNSFSATILTPQKLTTGNLATLRIVTQATNDTSTITPCGNADNTAINDYTLVYTLPSNDVAVTELVSPADGNCANNEQYITIELQNLGTKESGQIPLQVVINETVSGKTIANYTTTYPGSIAPGNLINYTLQTPFKAEAGTQYQLSVYNMLSVDQNPNNDTLFATMSIASKPAAPEAEAEICGKLALLRVLNPSSDKNYFWFQSATDSIALGRSSSLNTTVLTANQQYFVKSGLQATCGLTTKNRFPNGGGYLGSNTTHYLNYTSTIPTVLESVKLYTKYPGKINIYTADLISGYFYFLSGVSVDVYASSKNPSPGTDQGTSFDNADSGAIYQINLSLPAGSHCILAIPEGDANLFRNNNVTGSVYPFTIPGLISITGNSAPVPNSSFYYFFYNMKIRTQECVSDQTTVTASVATTPTVTQVGDSLISSSNSGNQWYAGNSGGTLIANATNQKYRPQTPGWYSVRVMDKFGCERTSPYFNYIVTSVTNIPAAEIGLQVGPNPSTDYLQVAFKVPSRTDLRIQLVNLIGQSVLNKEYSSYLGNFKEQLNTQHLPAGTYLLKIQQGNKTYQQKIAIQH